MANVLAHAFQAAQENHAVAEETFRLCDEDRLSEVFRKVRRSIEQHPHSKQADTTCCVSAERISHDSYPSSDDGDVPEWHLHFSNQANPLDGTGKRQLHYPAHMYMEMEGLEFECILPARMDQLEDIVRHHIVTVGPGYETELLQHLSHSTDALTSIFNELEIRLTSISPSECQDLPIKLKTYTELLWMIKRELCDESTQSREFKQLCDESTQSREFKMGYFAQFAKHPIEILVKIALLLSKMEWSVTDICSMMLAYEAVMDVVPLIQNLIPSESDDLLPKIKSNIWESFSKIVGSLGDPQDGAIHSVTCSLVDSVKIFHSHKELVQFFAPDDDCHSFGNLLFGVIESWISALEEHTMLDRQWKNIFILNNMSHLKGKTNGLLDDLLAQQHLNFPHLGYFKSLTEIWIQDYVLDAWKPALSCLWVGRHSSLVKFTSTFNGIFDHQKTWVVPDLVLRETLRDRIKRHILPTYSAFLVDYPDTGPSGCLCLWGDSAKEIYTTESLEKVVGTIFEGGTGQPTSPSLSPYYP
ncbi:exocyst complex component EXO70A1-like [Triticum dicoccoides]|uniref:exocyst complex component EXO70A1-like n=1 Tax=Triticum dicoccoides TaxID=85692 RepID=UPI000E79CB7A|nr:exocyst complex component EXO70A1-like [Triticum dicoccoides]